MTCSNVLDQKISKIHASYQHHCFRLFFFREKIEILYAGILSGGAAFALQIFGQKNISAAPAAIVMSLEGVVAAISAWIILNQILGINNIIGCLLILGGVLLSQLAPIYEKNYR